jgi:ryanodine receptor 2
MSEESEEASMEEDHGAKARPRPPSPGGKSTLNAAAAGSEFEAAEGGLEEKQDEVSPEQIKAESAKFGKWVLGMLARNFYNFKLIALALAFMINFILLFYKVSELGLGDEAGSADDTVAVEAAAGGGDGDGGDDEEPLEFVDIDDKVSYLAPFLRLIALMHTFTALAIMVAYYHLKIPLVIFKREKEIARILEFDGMWVAEQPADDDLRGHWDKLVISTKSWPDKYWDKFVKKKVRNKYAEQYEYDQISQLLGMDQGSAADAAAAAAAKKKVSILPAFLADMEWQYEIWKWGVIVTDNNFLYILFYLTMSILGNINYFFFAAHLIDIAVCFKTLGTILQSVTHNGKQLVLTVLLTSIVVYMYTVLAFNFFRKFYNKGEDGEDDYKCHDMLTCYVFHLYVGVRAGGGIGDEIDSPDGDPSEVYRILFDITFFFFVIVILLAIIQGLIIDAFGELRGQLEQVREDLESSCFICGIGKDYFDAVPHGFEIHVKNEHNFANYMFFLMHLINKPDTEYTGQETYVWELYQQRSWDFFPVGECFRKQYETELGGG